MRQKHFLGLGPNGFHRVAYAEWGDPSNPRVLVCVHGLTRHSRDFDYLAAALAADWRVVCPDMAGRGDSEWLPVKADYNAVTYRNDLAALLARLDADQVDWLGTSMGGILGMSLAAGANSPIRRLILNDIGAFIPAAGLHRIAARVGEDPRFADTDAAGLYLQETMATFGIRRTEHWQHVMETSTRPAEGGGLRLHYDPGIAETFSGALLEDTSLWPMWQAVRCPVLVLRGAQSDILPGQVAEQMTQGGPPTELVEFADCGHAPMLMEPEQVDVVASWLGRE